MRKLCLSILLAGCSVELTVPELSIVVCTTNVECPDPLVCVLPVGQCRPVGSGCIEANGDHYRATPNGGGCTLSDGASGICSAGTCIAGGGCGDGVQSAGELCDDGNGDDTDDCPDGPSGLCQPARCGDGVTHAVDETCDDGNSDVNDACPDGQGGSGDTRPRCQPASCGDGYVQTGVEQCDDHNDSINDACPSGPGGSCAPASCGDGFRRFVPDPLSGSVEACDDGNTLSNDGCQGDCQDTEVGFACNTEATVCTPICHDALRVGTEQCDTGPNVTGCTECQLDGPQWVCDDTSCSLCGNGSIDSPETCDELAVQTASCEATCALPACGDGTRNPLAGESCEANATDLSCMSCRISCAAGTANCDGNPANGCECSNGSVWRAMVTSTGFDAVLDIAARADGSTLILASTGGVGTAVGQHVCANDSSISCDDDGDCASSTCLENTFGADGGVAAVLHFSADGVLLAARYIEGACGAGLPCRVATHPVSGDIVVAATFTANLTVLGTCGSGIDVDAVCAADGDCTGNDCSAEPQITPVGEDIALVHFSSTLDVIATQVVSGAHDERVGGVAVTPGGDIYLSGSYCRETSAACTASLTGATCLPGPGCDELAATEERFFLASYDAGDQLAWVVRPNSAQDVSTRAGGVAVGPLGGAVITGGTDGSLPLGNDAQGNPVTLNLTTPQGLYVAAYDRFGLPSWISVRRAVHAFDGLDVAVQPNGGVVVAASFIPPIDGVSGICFGGTQGGNSCDVTTTCDGGTCGNSDEGRRAVLTWYTATGAYNTSRTFGSGNTTNTAQLNRVVALPDGSVYATGFVTGSTSLVSGECYRGAGGVAGDSCGGACTGPGSNCGHTVNPGTDNGVVFVHYLNNPSKGLNYGVAWSGAGDNGHTRGLAVAALADGSPLVGGTTCGGGAAPCSLTLGSVTPALSTEVDDGFVVRLPVP